MNTPAPPPNRHREGGWFLVGLAGILLLAAALRLGGLGQESLWFDEVHSLRIAQAGSPLAIWRALRNDVHPPLYFWLLHYWLRLVPPTEVGLRMLSALIGVCAVAAVYGWGRALGLPRRACLFAAAFLAVNPQAIWFSQETRMYGLEVLVGTCHLAVTAKVLHPRRYFLDGKMRKRDVSVLQSTAAYEWYVVWLLLGTALLWTHFFGVFFLAAEAVWACLVAYRLGVRGKASGAAPRPGSDHASTLAVGGDRMSSALWPLLAISTAAVWWGVSDWPLLHQMFDRFRSGQGIGWLAGAYPMSWNTPGEVLRDLIDGPPIAGTWPVLSGAAVAAMAVLVAAGFPMFLRGSYTGRISASALRRRLPVLIALILIGFPVLISLWRVIIFGGQRYLAIALAPIALGAGLGLHALLRRAGRARMLAAGAVAVLLAAHVVYLAHYYTGREKRMWREAVAFVDANARPGDVITATPGYSLWVVEHYESGELRIIPIERIASLKPPPERIWVVSVSPMAFPEERALVDSGWKPVRMQRVVEGSPSSYLRIVQYNRWK